MPTITIYLHRDCHLCERALEVLRAIATEHPERGVTLVERDIHGDDALLRAYFERVPVIELDGEEIGEYVVDEALLRARLAAGAPMPADGHPLESAR